MHNLCSIAAILHQIEIPAAHAKLPKANAHLKDSQTAGIKDKERKRQAYDLSFDAGARAAPAHRLRKPHERPPDFVVGTSMKYEELDGSKATGDPRRQESRVKGRPRRGVPHRPQLAPIPPPDAERPATRARRLSCSALSSVQDRHARQVEHVRHDPRRQSYTSHISVRVTHAGLPEEAAAHPASTTAEPPGSCIPAEWPGPSQTRAASCPSSDPHRSGSGCRSDPDPHSGIASRHTS